MNHKDSPNHPPWAQAEFESSGLLGEILRERRIALLQSSAAGHGFRCLGFRVWGLGFRVYLGFRVQGLDFVYHSSFLTRKQLGWWCSRGLFSSFAASDFKISELWVYRLFRV